jgi:GTP-binding protein Era
MSKAGFVTIIGRPNVGKSTLMNTLIGQKIAITSYRPQTTRNQIRTIYTDENGQIVFVDTPGMHEEKDRLGEYMYKAAESTLPEVDCILWLVEAKRSGTKGKRHGGKAAAELLVHTPEFTEGEGGGNASYLTKDDLAILKLLAKTKTPVIIVITKCDEIAQTEILPTIARYADEWQKITGREMKDIIPVSSRSGMGIADLKKTIFDKLPEGEPFYDPDMVTTETEREIAAEMIREKALRLLQEEVPHGIAVKINKMHTRKGRSGEPVCDIDADIICEREAHKGIIIGAKGAMLKKIGTAARIDIENMVGTKVNLQLYVKVRRDWKDDARALKTFGYNPQDLGDN